MMQLTSRRAHLLRSFCLLDGGFLACYSLNLLIVQALLFLLLFFLLSLVGNRPVDAVGAVHSGGYRVTNDRGQVKRERSQQALLKALLIASVSFNRIFCGLHRVP